VSESAKDARSDVGNEAETGPVKASPMDRVATRLAEKFPNPPAPKGRKRGRHFLMWWSVILLMLLTLGATFAFGSLLLGYVGWIVLDPAQAFQSPWHPVAAVTLGLFTSVGAAWLFIYGVSILNGVIRASKELAEERRALLALAQSAE